MKYRVPVLETFGWQEPVKSTMISAAPLAPAKGDRYIVPMTPTPADEWDGHAKDVAWFDGTIWMYDSPEAGWSAFVEDQLLAFTFNGTEWSVAEAGAVVTTELFVDKNRVGTYPENGSRSLPYKTITGAIASVIASGDNTIDKAYGITILPGVYDENLTFESTSLVNLTVKGTAVNSVFLRPNVGNAVQSAASNDNLVDLIFKDLTIDKPIVIMGASNGTNFGGALTLNDVTLTEEATLDVKNSRTLYVFGDHTVHSDVIIENVGMISLSNDSGLTAGKNLTIKVLPGANMPAGVTSSVVYVYGNTVQRDIVWDLTGGGVANVFIATAILGSAEDNPVVIPVGATYTAINSTLMGNYTYNGDLKLRGSFVTGTLDPASTGTLSMKVQSADMMSLGLPPDGALSDGLIDLSDDSTVVYAVDEFNEVLKDLAPPQADTLQGIGLDDNGLSLKSGRVPSGMPAAWYEAKSLTPGDPLNNVAIVNTIVLSTGTGGADSFDAPATVPVTASTTNSANFRKADEGILRAKHQIGAGAFDVVASLDMGANFKENPPGSSPPRPHEQDLSTWDDAGAGDTCTNAIVTMLNGKGTLQVTDVRWFNDFNKWQKGNARLNLSNVDEGYNKFSLFHDLAQDEESNELEVYYAPDQAPMTWAAEVTMVELALISTNYLSGVRYYDTDDTFTVAYSGLGVFGNIYEASKCSDFKLEARAAYDNRQPSAPPAVTDAMTINEPVAITRTNYFDDSSKVTARFFHPYKSDINSTSADEKRLVNTYPIRSTVLREYFTDENYRMEDGAYDSIPGVLTGLWDSSLIVPAGKAVIVPDGTIPKLRAGNVNLSDRLPAGNPDYSGRVGNEVYVRGFQGSGPVSGGTIDLRGLSGANVGQVGSGNVNVEIKLPTQTGWLDLGKPFNDGAYTGADGDGCQTAQSGSIWTITFGTKSTANSGQKIMVRVTFLNTSSAITQIIVNI